MSNSFFQFKQFTIYQDNCAMKVGTDGVLLGAWCSLNDVDSVLDIGTGTGLIALMIAQRGSPCSIDAIEVNGEAAQQAEKNISTSPWEDRIQVIKDDFNSFLFAKSYDLIVSNPPFFQNSKLSKNHSRNFARHNDSLSIRDILYKSSRLLTKNGRLALIAPFDLFEQIHDLAVQNRYYLIRKMLVNSIPNKPIRYLLEFSKAKTTMEESEMVIEAFGRHQYSSEYIDLCRGFYLNF